MKSMMKKLDYKVYPSDEETIEVQHDKIYNGAHNYKVKHCVGFNNGNTEYVEQYSNIRFVEKLNSGDVIPGLQSEQLAYILLDRAKKLNARFPSEFNERMINGLNEFINACEDRVYDRVKRGVMGDLKK